MNNKSTLQHKHDSFLTNLKIAKLFKNAIWADKVRIHKSMLKGWRKGQGREWGKMKLLERLVETLDRCSLDIADEEYSDGNRLSVNMERAMT